MAKFRAARRIWAQVMRDEFGAKDPKSMMLRFHTQTAGVQLTAQQPEVNLVRVAVQALAAVLGGTQSLHTNSYDEAIALPTEKAARLALRTQQVIAYESDLTATVDPFAGSYAVESMTDELEDAVRELMAQVEELGGAVAAIEHGFQKREIEQSAYDVAHADRRRERVVVGVNRFRRDNDEIYEPMRVDPAIEAQQVSGWPGCERNATATRWAGASTPCAPPPRATTTSSIPCTTRSGPGPRWARSATPARRLGCLPAVRGALAAGPSEPFARSGGGPHVFTCS